MHLKGLQLLKPEVEKRPPEHDMLQAKIYENKNESKIGPVLFHVFWMLGREIMHDHDSSRLHKPLAALIQIARMGAHTNVLQQDHEPSLQVGAADLSGPFLEDG